MGHCQAKFCPEDGLDDASVFCFFHWDILPQTSKDRIMEVYGTVHWQSTLKDIVQELILTEGDLADTDKLRRPDNPPKRDPRIQREISED